MPAPICDTDICATVDEVDGGGDCDCDRIAAIRSALDAGSSSGLSLLPSNSDDLLMADSVDGDNLLAFPMGITICQSSSGVVFCTFVTAFGCVSSGNT